MVCWDLYDGLVVVGLQWQTSMTLIEMMLMLQNFCRNKGNLLEKGLKAYRFLNVWIMPRGTWMTNDVQMGAQPPSLVGTEIDEGNWNSMVKIFHAHVDS